MHLSCNLFSMFILMLYLYYTSIFFRHFSVPFSCTYQLKIRLHTDQFVYIWLYTGADLGGGALGARSPPDPQFLPPPRLRCAMSAKSRLPPPPLTQILDPHLIHQQDWCFETPPGVSQIGWGGVFSKRYTRYSF